MRRPHATFEAVAASPRWLGLMVGLAIASALASALLYQTEVGRLALVDQWERTAIAFGQQVDDARYEELQDLSGQGATYAVATALLSGPALTLGISALFFMVLGSGPHRRSFRQMLAVVTHASVILTLRQVVAAPLGYARETTASAFSLGTWFPAFDEGSAAARFLGVIDLLALWWVVVLAIGLAVLYQSRARRVAAALIGIYASLAVALALAMAILSGTS